MEFKQVIKGYLDSRANLDSVFALKYSNKNKSIDECCNYIFKEARKLGNAVCMRDEEVYGMAIHYYDEENINDVEPINATVTTSDSIAPKQPAPVMHVVRNKNAVDSRQMSLF